MLHWVMATDAPEATALSRARTVEATFRAKTGLYLLGSLERGLTVYSQQVRAHNLVWALWHLSQRDGMTIRNVAVVGGGIAGLTTTACLLSRFGDGVKVTLFERREDLCPLQQGSDTRWLHPRIYDWPALGSRAPNARLPVLNWSEGRASDVAKTILELFGVYCKEYASTATLRVYLGLRYLQINSAVLEIQWIGNNASSEGAFLRFGGWEGAIEKFDIIILAVGFGLEVRHERFPLHFYWRNETYAQPALDGMQQSYVVSGFGDGALIDLFRLTIERYRQDTVLYDIFPTDLERVEAYIQENWTAKTPAANPFDFFASIEQSMLTNGIRELSKRLRKDTRVLLHLSGRNREITSFSMVFDRYSSFLNRLLLFMLYRCGAFHISFGDLVETAKTHGATGLNVLCRYGVDVMQHLRNTIVDVDKIEERLNGMKRDQGQIASELWEAGFFPTHG